MSDQEFQPTFREHVIQSLARIETAQASLLAIVPDHETRIRELKTRADNQAGRQTIYSLLVASVMSFLFTHIGFLKG